MSSGLIQTELSCSHIQFNVAGRHRVGQTSGSLAARRRRRQTVEASYELRWSFTTSVSHTAAVSGQEVVTVSQSESLRPEQSLNPPFNVSSLSCCLISFQQVELFYNKLSACCSFRNENRKHVYLFFLKDECDE